LTIRHDSIKLDNTYFTPEGFIKDDCIVTTTGVFTYHNEDGTTRREARLPEHVFDPASLESYEGKDIIITHETNKGGLIDGENFRDYTVGNIIKAYRDGNNVRCKILIKDVEALKNNPDLRELSLAYKPGMVKQPGIFNGEEYDEIQTNIRINNLAIVKSARAGENARLNLDEEDKKLDEQQKIPVIEGETIEEIQSKEMVYDNEDSVYAKIESLKAKDSYDSADISALLEILEEIAKPSAAADANSPAPVTDAAGGEGELKTLIYGIEELAKKYYKSNSPALDAEAATGSETAVKLDSADVDRIVQSRLDMMTIAAKVGLDVSEMTPSQARAAIVKKAMPDIRLDGLDVDTVYRLAVAEINKRKPLENQYKGFRVDGITISQQGKSTYDEKHAEYVEEYYNDKFQQGGTA